MKIFKVIGLLLAQPFKLLWTLGYMWGHSSSDKKRECQNTFWWSLIIFIAPVMMMWHSCQWRPIVRKRNALIEVNCKDAKIFSNQEVEEAYQYGLDKGWFDNHPELKKF